MILDSVIQLGFSFLQTIISSVIGYFLPDYQTKTENARNYIIYGLYGLVTLSCLSLVFLLNMSLGKFGDSTVQALTLLMAKRIDMEAENVTH